MKRLALHLAPAALLLLVVVLPLATGARTLFLRDTLLTHLSMRQGLVEPLRSGEIPLVDPLRGGGQALAGNLNAVALYPDNLLLLLASPLWQLNAHLWLHWLVAFAAAFFLARALGWGLPAASLTAVAYGTGGFVVSQLNLYNGIAAVALAPALAAAALGARRGSPASTVALAVLWALALCGGDPILAALGLVAAALVASAAPPDRGAGARRGWRGWRAPAWGVVCGTLLAAPQLLLTRALLAESYRGFQGFGAADLARAAPRPEALLELLLPLFFGRPDWGVYWGEPYFGGTPPLYFSLAPGAVALVLAAVALARGGAGALSRVVPAALAGAGLFLAFSAATPVARLLAAVPGMSLVRFQAKFALLFALGIALLAGAGAERLAADDRARALFRRAAAAGAALFGLVVLFLAIRPAAPFAAFVSVFGRGLSGGALELEVRRWAGAALFSAVALLLLALAAARRFERRELAVPAAIALQAGLQLLLLRGIFPSDESAFYRQPPALAAEFGPGDRLVQGAAGTQFGIERSALVREDRRLDLQVRDAWTSGFPFALHGAGLATDLDSSPEGLDHFTLHATESALDRLTDADRMRVLRALGVTHLLLPRELVDVPAEIATLARVDATQTPPLAIYAVHGAAASARFAPCASYAPQMNAALARMLAPDFDPGREAVVRGSAPPRCASGGGARIVREAREEVELELDAPEGGVVVLRRAYLPIWRAEIDGASAPILPAEMTRLAVEVPAGARRLRLHVDRAPLRDGVALAAAGALALALYAWRARRGQARPQPARVP